MRVNALMHDRLSAIFVMATVAVAGLIILGDNAELIQRGVSRGQMLGRDFVNYWCASVLAWRGDFSTIFDTIAFNEAFRQIMARDLSFNSFPYPPSGLWTVLPLAALDYGSALVVWTFGSFALFVAAVAVGHPQKGWTTVFLALSPAVLINAVMGQNGCLSAALLVAGLRLVESRPGVAGVLIGLLSFKPQLGVLLPFVLMAGGHWRTIVTAAATVAASVVGATLLMGPGIWPIYLEKGAAVQLAFMETGTGIYQLMIPTVFMAGRLLDFPLFLAHLAQGIVSMIVLAGAVIAFRARAPLEIRAATVMVGVFLATPYGFNYDMTIVTAALVMLVRSGPLCPGKRALILTAWFLPFLVMVMNETGWPFGPVILGALFLVMVSIALTRTEGAASAAPSP